jgi:hypothetical protein
MTAGELDGKTFLVKVIFFDQGGQRFFHVLPSEAEGIELFLYLLVTAKLVATIMAGLLQGLFAG